MSAYVSTNQKARPITKMPRTAPETRNAQNVLGDRMGAANYARRVTLQRQLTANTPGPEMADFHHRWIHPPIMLFAQMLQWTGLIKKGVQNVFNLTVRENPVTLANLPRTFDGLRVLHLSDLHIDGHPGFGQYLADQIAPLDFDVCVITGDYRYDSRNSEDAAAIAELEKLMPALECRFGVYGVMGDHDFIESALNLETIGIRTLLNESAPLRQNGSAIWLLGVDDPHQYRTADLDHALRDVPNGAAKILLAHSPELYEEAASHGIDLYLAGHTHGGQINIPRFAPLYYNARCPRRYALGAWRHGMLKGHTSPGIGASGVFARFGTPPEAIIHHLRHV